MTSDIESNEQERNSQFPSTTIELPSPVSISRKPDITAVADNPTKSSKPEEISISSRRFQDNEQGMDTGSAWVIDVASFFVQFFVIGNIFSFGVFLPVYIDAFNSDQSSVSWIGSIGSFLNVFLGIFIGGLDDRYGNEKVIFLGGLFIGAGYFLASFSTELWHLYVTHGVICGIGFSSSFISAASIVGQWFKKYRGLAIGFAVSGAGLGQFAMAQTNGHLIEAVGWRSALRYLALINVVGITLCSTQIKRRLPCGHHILNLKNQREFLSNGNFMLLCWGYMIFIFGMLIPNAYLLIYSRTKGVSFSSAVLILSVNGITNALGRIVTGRLADQSIGRLLLLKLSALAGGISCFCWLACTDFSSILAFSMIYGFVGGGAVSLTPSIAADILGVKKVSSFMGVLYSISSIANLVSTPIAGIMSDSFDSYTPAIVLAASCHIAAVLIFAFMRLNMYLEASRKGLSSASKGNKSMNPIVDSPPIISEGTILTSLEYQTVQSPHASRKIVNSPVDDCDEIQDDEENNGNGIIEMEAIIETLSLDIIKPAIGSEKQTLLTDSNKPNETFSNAV